MPRGRSAEECRKMGKPFTSETGRIAGKKSALARANRKTLARWVEECASDKDIKEIAQGMIQRAKKSTMAATALRDTLGEKPTEKMEVSAEVVTITAEERAEERRKYAESLKDSWMP